MTTEVQPPDPQARRKAVRAVALGAVAGIVVIFAFESYRPELQRWLMEDPASRLTWALGGLALLTAPLFFIVGHIWITGRTIVEGRRFPPPGRPVLRETPIVTGAAAVQRGRLVQGLALFLGLAVLGLLAAIAGIGYILRARLIDLQS